jgi:copper(I)-binding protein
MINSLRAPAGSAAMALALLLLPACGSKPQTSHVTVEEAWIRLPAAPSLPAAGYFLATSAAPGEEIVSVTSSAAKVEMHETMAQGGMSMMRPLSRATFGEEDRLGFKPGGKHLMLFGLNPKLRPGDKIQLSFRFKSAPPVTVEADVKALGDDGSEHAGH